MKGKVQLMVIDLGKEMAEQMDSRMEWKLLVISLGWDSVQKMATYLGKD